MKKGLPSVRSATRDASVLEVLPTDASMNVLTALSGSPCSRDPRNPLLPAKVRQHFGEWVGAINLRLTV